MNFQERKDERRKTYMENHGRRKIRCAACAGCGYYDNTGSPKCGACNGTGKVFERIKDVNHG